MQSDDDFDPRETYPALEALMAEDDAADPLLGSYQSPADKSGAAPAFP